MGEEINKMWYAHIVEYYSTIKKNENLINAIIWMNLGNIKLSERRQSEKSKYYMIILILKSRIRKSIEIRAGRLVVVYGWG